MVDVQLLRMDNFLLRVVVHHMNRGLFDLFGADKNQRAGDLPLQLITFSDESGHRRAMGSV